MSYDVSLYRKGLVDTDYAVYYDYTDNLTYNVKEMIDNAFGKDCFYTWHDRPAAQWLPILEKGVKDMATRPEYYKQFNSPNGWGTYETTFFFVEKLYKKVIEYSKFDGLENIYFSVC